MNLFYKYSHLQRFEQQNEKDDKMRNDKLEMTNEGEKFKLEKINR